MELLQTIWLFIQDQILGMKWLNALIGNAVSAIGLDPVSRWGGSIQFFIYDVIKITILLCTLIFMISYIQSYFPPERSKKILGRFHGIGANIIAALLGTVCGVRESMFSIRLTITNCLALCKTSHGSPYQNQIAFVR